MKTIPFNESARDVEHDASVEVPDNMREVLVSTDEQRWNAVTYFRIQDECWRVGCVRAWRELPAPPKPTPKIVPHSLEHWHDPKVEMPEPGRCIAMLAESGSTVVGTKPEVLGWNTIRLWTYAPETSR